MAGSHPSMENHYTWIKLDMKVKALFVEGVTVFLSVFDENPAVYRAFCPRVAYVGPLKPGELRLLPPLEGVVDTGLLGLNFSGRPKPGAGAPLGRDVETRLPALGTPAHSQDRGESRIRDGIWCLPPTSTTRSPRWCERWTRPATSAPPRSPARRG